MKFYFTISSVFLIILLGCRSISENPGALKTSLFGDSCLKTFEDWDQKPPVESLKRSKSPSEIPVYISSPSFTRLLRNDPELNLDYYLHVQDHLKYMATNELFISMKQALLNPPSIAVSNFNFIKGAEIKKLRTAVVYDYPANEGATLTSWYSGNRLLERSDGSSTEVFDGGSYRIKNTNSEIIELYKQDSRQMEKRVGEYYYTFFNFGKDGLMLSYSNFSLRYDPKPHPQFLLRNNELRGDYLFFLDKELGTAEAANIQVYAFKSFSGLRYDFFPGSRNKGGELLAVNGSKAVIVNPYLEKRYLNFDNRNNRAYGLLSYFYPNGQAVLDLHESRASLDVPEPDKMRNSTAWQGRLLLSFPEKYSENISNIHFNSLSAAYEKSYRESGRSALLNTAVIEFSSNENEYLSQLSSLYKSEEIQTVPLAFSGKTRVYVYPLDQWPCLDERGRQVSIYFSLAFAIAEHLVASERAFVYKGNRWLENAVAMKIVMDSLPSALREEVLALLQSRSVPLNTDIEKDYTHFSFPLSRAQLFERWQFLEYLLENSDLQLSSMLAWVSEARLDSEASFPEEQSSAVNSWLEQYSKKSLVLWQADYLNKTE